AGEGRLHAGGPLAPQRDQGWGDHGSAPVRLRRGPGVYCALEGEIRMRRPAAPIAGLLVALSVLAFARTSAQSRTASPLYFPERFGGGHRTPAEAGMNPSLVDEPRQPATAN